ncbi:hypothetical protein MNBD_GAMMA09-64 [hydrothermal vent metagenome]|uniref:Uncharacterized protein n=1 Tax=hydrothermal vent metagenome TaxID=652676 RepID=A0A3B0Y291_9ZZZZ
MVKMPIQIKPTPIIGEVMIQSWQDAGLLKASVIKPVITTIEKNRVIQRMGELQKYDLSSLQGSLEIILTKK